MQRDPDYDDLSSSEHALIGLEVLLSFVDLLFHILLSGVDGGLKFSKCSHGNSINYSQTVEKLLFQLSDWNRIVM